MKLNQFIEKYEPYDEAEAADCASLKQFLQDYGENIYTRDNLLGHITVSCFIVNRERTKALAAFHNIMQNFAWLGGHADGDKNLQRVTLKEIQEESGLENVAFIQPEPIDVEVLMVYPHIKRGCHVSAHLHYNIAYLLEADEEDVIRIKADENSDIRWVEFDELLKLTDPFSAKVYERIINKIRERNL